ncbi:MAG: FHA domain-containing protein [Muribaculaceae bacterium]|nr:FHA domain-containing protein [Muribaculaceae bacterium]
MEEVRRIPLKCPHCGTLYNYKAPSAPGSYSVSCINKECGQKLKFNYGAKPKPEVKAEEKKIEEKPIPKVQPGWQENGAFVIRCDSPGCGQLIRMTADKIHTGKNSLKCPRCGKPHSFEKEPSEEELLQEMLKCKTAGCDGSIDKDTGICDSCQTKYALHYDENGKIEKVVKKTDPIRINQNRMKLVVGNFLGKKEYILKEGTHYVGRFDEESQSDFAIKDKFASKRSVRIDVTFDQGGNLVYKLTVERGLNPVYHNNRELVVGDIDYLNYGDTIKLGKTLIKVQKIEKQKK